MYSSATTGWRSPIFTAAQWLELEHQALIYKYLMSGVSIPPDLLIPIRRSFFHFSSLGYSSYYGKKLDPEPGRCRRTDGKKWRCSKDAYPDSKYCERHMHRTRNRSRKPVEMPVISQSQPPSSNATSLSANVSSENRSGCGSFSLRTVSVASSNAQGASCNGESGTSLLHMDRSGSYALCNKYNSSLHGGKARVDESNFFEASGSAKGLLVEQDSSWCPIPSQLSKAKDCLLQGSYPFLQPSQDHLGRQPSFFGSEFDTTETLRNESQLLRPFFDEWPKTRDSWSDLGEERSNGNSFFATTQLSISTPMSSPNSTTPCSVSPDGVCAPHSGQ